jgi:hypothetical protein
MHAVQRCSRGARRLRRRRRRRQAGSDVRSPPASTSLHRCCSAQRCCCCARRSCAACEARRSMRAPAAADAAQDNVRQSARRRRHARCAAQAAARGSQRHHTPCAGVPAGHVPAPVQGLSALGVCCACRGASTCGAMLRGLQAPAMPRRAKEHTWCMGRRTRILDGVLWRCEASKERCRVAARWRHVRADPRGGRGSSGAGTSRAGRAPSAASAARRESAAQHRTLPAAAPPSPRSATRVPHLAFLGPLAPSCIASSRRSVTSAAAPRKR